MADENNTGSIADGIATDAPAKTPAPKKQRAPRRQRAVAEATAAAPLAKTAKAPRGRRKRSEQADETKPALAETQVAGKNTAKDAVKGVRRKRAARQTGQTVAALVPVIDEMADLIQLEEENKRLRKTLADKLRAENADLRKRLGLG